MSESPSWQQHPGAAEAEVAAAAAAPPDAPSSYVGVPGVRFVPSDQELILDYLMPKLHGEKPRTNLVREDDVYADHPKKLTKRLGRSAEGFWYVYSERNRKYPKGKRPSRSTGTAGRWKAVGKNMPILRGGDDSKIIGHKCALAYEVFVRDGPSSRPRTEKTEWKMCEFVAGDTNKPISSEPGHMLLNKGVLCRITRKTAARKEAMLEDPGQTPLVDEPEEQLPTALLPDPFQQAQAQLMPMPYLPHDGADGGTTEVVGTEGFDADLETPPPPPPVDGDDGGAAYVQFVEWSYHPEPWGDDEYGVGSDHQHQWNVVGVDQFGAATDPDPIELPSDPLPWDDANTLIFADDGHELVLVEANDDDDVGKDDAAAKKTSKPANADSQT